MRSKVSRKVRQHVRRNWRKYFAEIYDLPLKMRLRIAWSIIRAKRSKGKRS